VVKADKGGSATLECNTLEGGDDEVGVDGALDDDGWALSCELVDDVQQLDGPVVLGRVELEVKRPEGVWCDRAHRPNLRADATQRGLALAVGHAQALLSPEALDALVVHLPSLSSGLLGSTAPSPAGAFSREVPQELA
jgi:hypothetical protein